jgi:hypothetical protein
MFLHINELKAASIDPATIKKGHRIIYEVITAFGISAAVHVLGQLNYRRNLIVRDRNFPATRLAETV